MEKEDSSTPDISIIPPPDSSQQEVPVQYYASSWWQLPHPEFFPPGEMAPESYRLASFHDTTGVPLTSGEAPLPNSPNVAQYEPTWGASPFDVEEIDDTGSIRLRDFSLPLSGIQTRSDAYHPYPYTQNASPVEYASMAGRASPANQGPSTTPYYTPPEDWLPLTPLSASPLTNSPSPLSSLPSTLRTTPEGEFSSFSSFPDHGLYKVTGQECGRAMHCERPSVPSSRMPSPLQYTQQPPLLQPMDGHLEIPSPRSALMGRNPSALARRHTISEGPDRRPSRPVPPHYANGPYEFADPSVGVVVERMDLLTIGPSPPSPSMPVGLPPTSTHRGSGQVASEAIIAACKGRRKRKAKFKCDICPQTFTARHNLINHQKAHKGIRDQICPFCDNAFTASGTLTRHTRTCRGKSAKRVA
ncbi:hypothetical protein MD484_g1919, partial [Candolleomyces efflorescens]